MPARPPTLYDPSPAPPLVSLSRPSPRAPVLPACPLCTSVVQLLASALADCSLADWYGYLWDYDPGCSMFSHFQRFDADGNGAIYIPPRAMMTRVTACCCHDDASPRLASPRRAEPNSAAQRSLKGLLAQAHAHMRTPPALP